MYRLHLSLKFLRHHWLMTLIGSFFVGASLVILVVVMSIMDGFQQRLKDTFAGFSADYVLVPRFPAPASAVVRAVEAHVPEVAAAAPFHETVSLVQKAGPVDPLRDKLEFAQVFGVDGWREQQVNRFGEYLRDPDGRPTVRDLTKPFEIADAFEAASGTKGVIVGEGLRRTLGVSLGDKIKIASIRKKGAASAASPQTSDYDIQWLRYRVVGIYSSGNGEKDARCLFLEHDVVEDLWSADVRRSGIRARLKPDATFEEALLTTKAALDAIVRDAVPPGTDLSGFDRNASLSRWQDENPTLMAAIESEKSMILVIAFLIVVAGTSSIFAAQWLLVSDKVREIGILRALGASVEGVMTVFVFNGLLMGAIGSVGGTLLGLLVVREIDAVHAFITRISGRDVFPSDIYLFQSIPTKVNYGEVTQYAFAALVCTLVASAIPALRAGLMDPARALHRD